MNHINYANKVTQQYSEDNNQTTQTRTWHADVWKILKSTRASDACVRQDTTS